MVTFIALTYRQISVGGSRGPWISLNLSQWCPVVEKKAIGKGQETEFVCDL